MKFELGGSIGDYTLLARCGEGAYGVVFLAENAVTRQKVALKVVPAAGKNFERELKGLRQYQQICRRTDLMQIYHVGAGEDFFYYTMNAADPLDDGADYTPKTLANVLKKKGKMPPAEILTMADEVISSLEVLHRKGMAHRDVKPENILWIDGMAVPGDVGLIADGGRTAPAGTPGFMPPEVLAGVREYEAKDDFYALGKVLYCALTGLPVTRYPSFPESSTLTGAGEVIRLYGRLCAGETIERKPRKRPVRKIVCLAGALCLLALAFFTGRYWHTWKITPAGEGPAYMPSGEMTEILPELRKHYRELEGRMYSELGNVGRNISDAEIAEAEKFLARHPEHPLSNHPVSFVVDRKNRRITEDFDRKHRDDPVWRYFRNREEIAVCVAHLRGQIFPRRYSDAGAREKLRVLYRAQRALEAEILKKYRK